MCTHVLETGFHVTEIAPKSIMKLRMTFSSFVCLFVLFYHSIYMGVTTVYMCVWYPRREHWSYKQLWANMSVLGTGPRSTGRGTDALKPKAILSASTLNSWYPWLCILRVGIIGMCQHCVVLAPRLRWCQLARQLFPLLSHIPSLLHQSVGSGSWVVCSLCHCR